MFRILRDPAWGSLGALASVVAIFVAFAVVPTDRPGELAIVRTSQIPMSSLLIPGDQVRILVREAKLEPDSVVVDYFILVNDTPKAILASDIEIRLQINPAEGVSRIVNAEPCSEKMTQSCSPSGGSTSDIHFVNLDWTELNGTWYAKESLLNSKDQACVLVIAEKRQPKSDLPTKLKWGGHIKNTKIAYYESISAYQARPQARSWSDYLAIFVVLRGIGIFWFMVLQVTFTIAVLYMARRIGWVSGFTLKDTGRFILILVLATTSSEILVDILVNNRLAQQHPISWPLLALHVLLIAYLTFQARRISRLPPAPPQLPTPSA